MCVGKTGFASSCEEGFTIGDALGVVVVAKIEGITPNFKCSRLEALDAIVPREI